jgi:hypothetical protein
MQIKTVNGKPNLELCDKGVLLVDDGGNDLEQRSSTKIQQLSLEAGEVPGVPHHPIQYHSCQLLRCQSLTMI